MVGIAKELAGNEHENVRYRTIRVNRNSPMRLAAAGQA